MINVVAILTAKPGQRDALLAAIHGNLDAVRAEAGCLEYAPAIDMHASPAQFGEDVVVMLEKWSSADALAAHARAPHMVAFGAATRPLMSARAIHVLQPA